jgi:hypothetical protein
MDATKTTKRGTTMRRYFLKVEVCGKFIPAESIEPSVQYYYISLEEVKIVASLLEDKGYKTRIDVVTN